MRSTGTAVNTAVVIACAEGILLHKAPDLLSRVNLGSICITKNGLCQEKGYKQSQGHS